MPWCRDPLVAQLNSLGFNALRVPRSDYEPSKLLIRHGNVSPVLFGSLADGFMGVSSPEVTIGAAGQFAKAASARYRRALGLKLAGDWLGATVAKLEFVFSATSAISFRFGDVRLLSIPLAVLSRAIANAEPTLALVEVVGARLFVISEVLQAKEFILLAEGGSAQSLDAAAPTLEPLAAAADISIDASKAHAGVFVFRAAKYHSIGFKAYELEVAGGGFCLAPTAASAALSHLSEGEPAFEPILFDEHRLF